MRGPNVVIRTFHIWQEDPPTSESLSPLSVEEDSGTDRVIITYLLSGGFGYNSGEKVEDYEEINDYNSEDNSPLSYSSFSSDQSAESPTTSTPASLEKEARVIVQLHCTKWPGMLLLFSTNGFSTTVSQNLPK